MASKSLGTLTLDVVAKIGGYTAGLDKAEKEAQKRAKAIEKAFDGAATAVGVGFGLMTTAAIGAFAAISKGIEEAGSFQDLAEKTGASAEGLAALSVAAKVGGASMEDVANASVKLTKGLTGVDDESKAAGAALEALGIPIEEFKRLAPEQQMLKVAEALGGFADGAGKTAVAVDLFGKAGANLLPFLKELYQQGGLQKILTAEQIKQADEYSDKLARQKAEFALTASAVSTQFLPAITALMGVVNDAAKEMTGLTGSTTDLGNSKGVQTFAENAIAQLAFVLDALQGVKVAFQRTGEFIGAAAAAIGQAATFNIKGAADIGKDFSDSLDKDKFKSIKGAYEDALKAQKELAANQKIFGSNRPGAPTLAYNGVTKPKGGGGKGAVDDPTKKLLDNELASYKAMADQAKELLSDRNKMLDLYNQQGLISVKDYYAALNAATAESTAAQAKAIDDQIAALQKFKAAAKKDTDVADTQGKINKLEEEKAKLYRQSGIAAIESSVKQVQAQKAVQDAANEVNAKILELKGNLGQAAAIRFDASNEGNLKMFTAEGRQDMVAAVGELRNYTIAQAELNKLQQQFSLAQGDLQIKEERISQARERGTMGEIQSLKASGEARKEAIAIMEKQLAVFQAIDAAARTPEQAQAIERLKVQLEGLKATADPLADKFNTLFSDAAGNAFGDFISGTKSAKDAFKDFANQVINDIGRMVAKDLAKSLFSGALGGSGGEGGFNIGSFLSGIFGSGKGFADGGFTGGSAANDPVGFVHRNEYVLNEKTTRRLGVSNLDSVNSGGSMGGFTQVVNIQGRPTNDTTNQIANQARRATQRAARLV